MKKLMIAAAIVCAAAFVQAATVTWTGCYISTATTKGGWTKTMLGADDTGYTATLYLFTDAEMTKAVDLKSGYTSSTWEEGITADNVTGDALTTNPATTYYGKLICTTSVNGELQTLESQAFKFTTNPMENYPSIVIATNGDDIGGTITDLDGNEFTGAYGAFTASGWTAAPEPTSGLLLLIGVAGLALRRKRA